MKEVRVTTGLIPLVQFKARAPEILKELVESGHPLILTQRGRAAAVLLAPKTYEAMLDRQRVLNDLGQEMADEEAARLRLKLEMQRKARAWREKNYDPAFRPWSRPR